MDSVSPEQLIYLSGSFISLIGRFIPLVYRKKETPVQNIINHNYNNYYNVTVIQYPPVYKEVKLIEEDRNKEI